MIILALAFTGLLGMVGVVIDLGFGYGHHREVQNAADAGAMAGGLALARHYSYVGANAAGQAGALGLSDTTDAMIQQEITSAAAASVPAATGSFPDPSTTPSWPSGTGNTLTATYLVTDGATPPNITVGAAVGGGSIPPSAAGIQVFTHRTYSTMFAQVLGPCCTQVGVYGSGKTELFPSQPPPATGAGAPFIVCGGGPSSGGSGAYNVNTGALDQIIRAGSNPPAIDPAFVGQTYEIHGPQLSQGDGAGCGAGSQWKGLADNNPCVPIGTSPLPCMQNWLPGTRAGPVRTTVAGLPGCNGSNLSTCVALLPVADYFNNQFRVQLYAPFLITEVSANVHDGTLLPAVMIDGQVGAGSFQPTDPGTFTVKMAP